MLCRMIINQWTHFVVALCSFVQYAYQLNQVIFTLTARVINADHAANVLNSRPIRRQTLYITREISQRRRRRRRRRLRNAPT